MRTKRRMAVIIPPPNFQAKPPAMSVLRPPFMSIPFRILWEYRRAR